MKSIRTFAGSVVALSVAFCSQVFLVESSAVAAETQVLAVSSGARPGVDTLNIISTPEQGLSAVVLVEGKKRDVFSLADLAKRAVLLKEGGREILRLQTGAGFDVHSGGLLNLTYLSNGITMSYGTFQMELVKQGDGWFLQTAKERRTFTKMRIDEYKPLGFAIGVRISIE